MVQKGDIKLVEYPLERLQSSISRFIVPSAAFPDAQAMKAQIELRRRALRDIEIISTRLRLSKGPTTKSVPRRKKGRRAGHPYTTRVLQSRRTVRPV